ncbi:MAG: hypothetical protein ChlgKO_10710 [Chlamydiales bacterium]
MSSVGPVTPDHTPHQAESTAKVGKGSHDAVHKWGNMTFTQQQWHMFMKTLEQNVSLEIKKENDQWKRQNQRMRQMWSGG